MAPGGDQASGKGVSQIAKANHGACPVGLDAPDDRREKLANLLGREGDPASAHEEMFAEGNDLSPRRLISLQRPHDGRMERQGPRRAELGWADHHRAGPKVEVGEPQLARLGRTKPGAEHQPDHRLERQRPEGRVVILMWERS